MSHIDARGGLVETVNRGPCAHDLHCPTSTSGRPRGHPDGSYFSGDLGGAPGPGRLTTDQKLDADGDWILQADPLGETTGEITFTVTLETDVEIAVTPGTPRRSPTRRTGATSG